jgi:glycosyltransferase involved in cell wall biosynthesis
VAAGAGLRRILRQERPAIVHLHSRRGADTLGALAALGCGARVVLSRRVDNPESRPVVALKYRLVDHVIAISGAIGRLLQAEGVPGQRITCVRDAVDPEPWRHAAPRAELEAEFSLAPGTLAIGMAAQFIPRKGHDVLLDALGAVVEQQPAVQVLLFGKGREQERIQRRVRSEGLAQHVIFPGFRDDLPRWFGALDLLVHPASREGLGVALLQAASAGLPMVACDAGGIGEIVIDEQTGLLVPPEDAGALSRAILRLLEDRELARRLAAAALERVEREFSIEGMARAHLGVYRALVDAAP